MITDDLRTILWPIAPDGDAASWALRKQVWEDPRAMLGGSDAGAHLDRMCGAPYTTRFLGDMISGRQLVPIERAVQMITDRSRRGSSGSATAACSARGRTPTSCSSTRRRSAPTHATLVADLPGGSAAADRRRRRASATSSSTASRPLADNQATGATPGTVLRSGRDTETVATR